MMDVDRGPGLRNIALLTAAHRDRAPNSAPLEIWSRRALGSCRPYWIHAPCDYRGRHREKWVKNETRCPPASYKGSLMTTLQPESYRTDTRRRSGHIVSDLTIHNFSSVTTTARYSRTLIQPVARLVKWDGGFCFSGRGATAFMKEARDRSLILKQNFLLNHPSLKDSLQYWSENHKSWPKNKLLLNLPQVVWFWRGRGTINCPSTFPHGQCKRKNGTFIKRAFLLWVWEKATEISDWKWVWQGRQVESKRFW